MKFYFGFFLTFSQFKNSFLSIFEIAKKWHSVKKIFFREIDLFDFTGFFWPGLFLMGHTVGRHDMIIQLVPMMQLPIYVQCDF